MRRDLANLLQEVFLLRILVLEPSVWEVVTRVVPCRSSWNNLLEEGLSNDT